MDALVLQPPRCRACDTILQPPGQICSACHAEQGRAPQQIMQQFVPAKSKGTAVLLTFLWLGAGHMYAEKIGVGIALAIIDTFLVLLGLTGIGLIIAFPIWIVLFIIAALLSASAVEQFNAKTAAMYLR